MFSIHLSKLSKMIGISSQSNFSPPSLLSVSADRWTHASTSTHKAETNVARHIEHYLPAGTFDTHVHVFDPQIVPYCQNRSYTPQKAPLQDLINFSQRYTSDSSPTNLILVQPSPYGTDNTLLVWCLGQLRQAGLHYCRGIAVVDLETVELSGLRKLHEAGVRGIRIASHFWLAETSKWNLALISSTQNTEASGITLAPAEIIQRISRGIDLVKYLPNWSVQVFVSGSIWKRKFVVMYHDQSLTKI